MNKRNKAIAFEMSRGNEWITITFRAEEWYEVDAFFVRASKSGPVYGQRRWEII